MADFVSILKNNWKINQTLGGYGPLCSLVSLYDLIFDSNDDTSSYDSYRISSTGSWISGIKLDHDIICYNSSVYNTTGDVIKTNKLNFLNYGLDICPARFDPAAKYYKLSTTVGTVTSELKIFDKSAALYPSSTLNFEGLPWDSVDPDSTADLTYTPISLGIGGPGVQLNTTLQLAETDPIFNATIKQDGLTSYTKIALNTNNYKTWQIIGFFIDDINSKIDTLSYIELRTLLHEYKEVLKYCYVWLKVRYFGDYINQDDFEQELNMNASVQHKNINVSSSGDFNRYEKSLVSTDKSKADAHRPYIPKTVPSFDILSDSIYPGYKYSDDTDVNSVITTVISKTSFTDNDPTNIGTLQTTPVNTVFTDTEGTANEIQDHTLDSLTHPGYFDPESRMTPSEYDHKPVLVPKDGNIITDGRIMSPTIDEIWTYIKRLVDGRINDNTALPTDISAPRSQTTNKRITEDILPVPAKNFRIYDKLNVSRVGDPLETTIINTDEFTTREKLVIKSYINAPEGIVLNQYDQVLRISEVVVGATGKTDRDITNFTPWQENPAEYEDVRDSNAIQPDKINTATLQTSSLWGPRVQPLSIREIEALLKEAKLNIISVAKFVKENFAVTGSLGRELNTSNEIQKARGSLYQLHKDYNFKIDDPNTVFGMTDGQITLPVGETRNLDGFILGKSKTTNNDYYGQSSEVPVEANSYGSSEVYLAADGTWRALWSHVRIPIVSEEF